MTTAITPFAFGDNLVRVITDENGDPWFVAKDVALALGYAEGSNPSRLLQSVPEEWKGVKQIHTLGGIQEMWLLSEQGLYFFLGRSDKPGAFPFQKWMAGDVMPTLRKTGTYTMPTVQPEPEFIHEETTEAISSFQNHFAGTSRRMLDRAATLGELVGLTDPDAIYEIYLCYVKLLRTREPLTEDIQAELLSPDVMAALWREVSRDDNYTYVFKNRLSYFVALCEVIKKYGSASLRRRELAANVEKALAQYMECLGEKHLSGSLEITICNGKVSLSA